MIPQDPDKDTDAPVSPGFDEPTENQPSSWLDVPLHTAPRDPDKDSAAPVSPDVDEESERRKKHLPLWLEFPLLIVAALLIAVLIKTFLFQAFWIPSSSMENTLQIYDRVLVSKLSYELSDIARGDIIVFDDPRAGFEQPDEDPLGRAIRNLKESIGLATPQSEFIKRVIGVPGDVVEGKDGSVYVNGARLDEPYLKGSASLIRPFGPVEVHDGSLFVMGDNRGASQDSRFFGPIPIDDVVGKAFIIIWPPSRAGGI
ncbi:MAG: signal peptidase I [Actinobacteria bacterium]|nr:MAG: signal peptidase I [Actinomycetota bacterium]